MSFDLTYFTQPSVLTLILVSAAVVLTLLALLPVGLRVGRVSRAIKRHSADVDDCIQCSEPVSVVVRANDDSKHLSELLPLLLDQDYAPGFEVIVVNEGTSPAVEEVVDSLRLAHPNLYYTYAPDGARNLSRKKLALMLGVKAARNRIVVHTTSSAVITSPQWLATMVRNFADPDTCLNIGYADIAGNDTKGWGHRSRAFDSAADSLAWLAAAVRGKVYRGTGHNLAYTRDAFFEQKGFSHTLDLKNGDDDLFVCDVARNGSGHSCVELADPARVACQYSFPRAEVREYLADHRFTGRKLPKGARRMLGASSWAYILLLLDSAAIAVVAWPNLWGLVIGIFFAILVTVWGLLLWRKTLRILSNRRMLLTLPWLWATRPCRGAMCALRVARHRRRHRN